MVGSSFILERDLDRAAIVLDVDPLENRSLRACLLLLLVDQGLMVVLLRSVLMLMSLLKFVEIFLSV